MSPVKLPSKALVLQEPRGQRVDAPSRPAGVALPRPEWSAQVQSTTCPWTQAQSSTRTVSSDLLPSSTLIRWRLWTVGHRESQQQSHCSGGCCELITVTYLGIAFRRSCRLTTEVSGATELKKEPSQGLPVLSDCGRSSISLP